MEEFEQHHIDDLEKDTDWVSSPVVIRTDKNLVVKDQFLVTDSEVQMLRGQRIARKAISGNYTMAVQDYLIGITSLASAPSIGLPKPSMASLGKIYLIKDEVGGAATTTITVRAEGERTIDGSTSLSITTNYASYQFYTDGGNWFIY